jgi:flagellar hook-associated protein 1 FlgK
MGNLFASLDAAAGALRAFRDGINVSQNNIQNASTPGFAKQTIQMEALPFQLGSGAMGGVRTGAIVDSRSSFAERAVRQQLSTLGNFTQQAARLAQIEGIFDVGTDAGIPGAMDQLFSAFAEFSQSPESPGARQSVLEAAGQVAASFHQAAREISRLTSDIDADLRATVEKINQTAAQIQQYNHRILQGSKPDTGLQSVAFADAETLAELADVEVLMEPNGTMTVLLGGQTPVVIGDHFQPIRLESYTPAGAVNPGATPSMRLLDSEGRDITGTISQGSLGGLLRVRTDVLPALAGDSLQNGSLNELARNLAERTNEILTSGLVSAGPPPVAGVALFDFNPANNADIARSLTLNPAITQDQLAAIAPGPPYVSNGTALALADLRNSRAPQDTVNGMTYFEYYSSMARQVGDGVRSMRQEEARSNLLVTQARDLRTQLSGVSFDEEAVKLVEFQRAYEANAQVVKIVDELIESVISMLR